MSDNSQQVEEVQEDGNQEVEVEVEQPLSNDLAQFTDPERELEQIVSKRQAEKKRERAEAKARAEGKRIPGQDASDVSPGSPQTAPDVSTQPTTETPSPDESSHVVAGQEGRETPSDTPASGTLQPGGDTPASTEPFTYRFRDTDFDESYIQNGIELKAWSDSLPEQAKVGINAYLSGEYVLVDRKEYEKIQKGEKVQAQPTPESATPTLTDEDLAELPPSVAASIRQQQEQLAQISEWRQQQEAAQQQQQIVAQQNQIRSAVDKVTAEIKSTYALTDEEFKKLDDLTGKSGYVPRLAVAYGGDVEKALREAFQLNYDKNFQQRELQRQALANQTATAKVEAQDSKVKSRKANAAALNPAGNSVPSGNNKPVTSEDKRAARVADIAEMLMQGG